MATRPSKTCTFLKMARDLSEQSTCSRRNVGVIMTNRLHQIIASGYNGGATKLQHCIDKPCAGATCKSGTGLDLCEAIHAEQNALMFCKDVGDIVSVYCTTAPCTHCIKMLLNTGAKHIFFIDNYPHADSAKHIWLKSNVQRTWEQVTI